MPGVSGFTGCKAMFGFFVMLGLGATALPTEHATARHITFAPVPQRDSSEWEERVLGAWAAEPDCSPATGMCPACGLGVAIVEIGADGQPIHRTYSVAAGDAPDIVSPHSSPFSANATFEIASITPCFSRTTAS